MELCTRAYPKATPRRSWVPFQPTLLLEVIGLGDRCASGGPSFLGKPPPPYSLQSASRSLVPKFHPRGWLCVAQVRWFSLPFFALQYFFNKTTTVYFSILVLMGICVAETKNDLIPSDYVFSWLLGAQA